MLLIGKGEIRSCVKEDANMSYLKAHCSAHVHVCWCMRGWPPVAHVPFGERAQQSRPLLFFSPLSARLTFPINMDAGRVILQWPWVSVLFMDGLHIIASPQASSIAVSTLQVNEARRREIE